MFLAANMIHSPPPPPTTHPHTTRMHGQNCIPLQAFLAASMKTDEELLEWFKERLVWTDPAVITNLLKAGLFIRAYEPQVPSPFPAVPGLRPPQ